MTPRRGNGCATLGNAREGKRQEERKKKTKKKKTSAGNVSADDRWRPRLYHVMSSPPPDNQKQKVTNFVLQEACCKRHRSDIRVSTITCLVPEPRPHPAPLSSHAEEQGDEFDFLQKKMNAKEVKKIEQ